MTVGHKIVVEALRPEQTGRAYAVAQAALPELGFEQWSHFVEAMGRDDAATASRGILLARDPDGLLLGLVAYRLGHDLQHGPMLVGENLIAFGLLDRRPVAESLAEALEEIAERQGCRAVHLSVPQAPDGGSHAAADSWLAALLRGRGHRIEGLTLCKWLSPAGG